jgi:hypothetical protein
MVKVLARLQLRLTRRGSPYVDCGMDDGIGGPGALVSFLVRAPTGTNDGRIRNGPGSLKF